MHSYLSNMQPGAGDRSEAKACSIPPDGEGGVVTSRRKSVVALGFLTLLVLTGCASEPLAPAVAGNPNVEYLIGPGDQLRIFVWQNPDVSTTVPVRPDGKISMPLIQDLLVAGKTPTQVGQEIEQHLSKYIRNPQVSVIVTGLKGTFSQQIRVIGQAAKPQAIPYRRGLTLLDVMIQVGGLTENAAGNKATLVRRVDGKQRTFRVRLDDLIRDGDIGANIQMLPGDIVTIPESTF